MFKKKNQTEKNLFQNTLMRENGSSYTAKPLTQKEFEEAKNKLRVSDKIKIVIILIILLLAIFG